jgi:ribonuclease P/MRP protein subunit POP1
MGFVTSGNFSLSRGKGYAIGAISLVKFLETREQAHRQVLFQRLNCAAHYLYTMYFRLGRANDWLVKVRNRDGMICRAARIDYLE